MEIDEFLNKISALRLELFRGQNLGPGLISRLSKGTSSYQREYLREQA
jgi:hypothetical protein